MNSSSKSPRPILARLRFWLQNRQTEKQLIEHVIETVEPKIRLASGYRKKLRRPIQICLEHCKAMVTIIPGPIHLRKSDYDADPLIHAAFIGPVKLKDLIENQDSVSIPPIPAEPDRYALLTMTHRETTIFGPKIQGDMILNDAQMKSVTFTDHKIVGLSTTLESSRNKLEQICFQMILEAVSRELATKRTNLRELREHLERLHAMSHIFGGGNHAQNVFGHSSHEEFEKLKEVEQMLEESEDELVHARQGYETPEDWLAILIDHLTIPEKIMHIQRISMRLDWRNVLTEASEENANNITLAQCLLADKMKRDAVFICY